MSALFAVLATRAYDAAKAAPARRPLPPSVRPAPAVPAALAPRRRRFAARRLSRGAPAS